MTTRALYLLIFAAIAIGVVFGVVLVLETLQSPEPVTGEAQIKHELSPEERKTAYLKEKEEQGYQSCITVAQLSLAVADNVELAKNRYYRQKDAIDWCQKHPETWKPFGGDPAPEDFKVPEDWKPSQRPKDEKVQAQTQNEPVQRSQPKAATEEELRELYSKPRRAPLPPRNVDYVKPWADKIELNQYSPDDPRGLPTMVAKDTVACVDQAALFTPTSQGTCIQLRKDQVVFMRGPAVSAGGKLIITVHDGWDGHPYYWIDNDALDMGAL
jgi:hypothetical protein